MKIIGISGKRGTGKSMLSEYLTKHGFMRVSLADDLKARCRKDFGITKEETNGKNKELPSELLGGLTPRQVMINMGAFYRSVDPLFWCKTLMFTIETNYYIRHYEKFVIDDIRFPNEVNYFKEKGAKFVRLERLNKLNVFKKKLNDPSETALDSYPDWSMLLSGKENRTPKDLKKFAKWINGIL